MASEHPFQENIRFARFIEKYPCLYDHKCKGYSNKNATEKAWNEVAEEFQLTVNECKYRWKNIRTVFRRHVFAKPQSGLPVASKRDYYLSDVLQYLIPILRDNTSHIKNVPPPSKQLAVDDNDQNTCSSMSEKNAQTPEIDMDDIGPICELVETPTTYQQSVSDVDYLWRNEACKRKSSDALNEAMTDYFRAKATGSIGKVVDVEDSNSKSDEMFLLSLKEDMKEMNAHQKRKFKRGIYNLIDEILLGGSVELNSYAGSTSVCNGSEEIDVILPCS